MQPGQNAETPPPRCSNDSFFILIPPANAETDHRYRHFGGSELVRTEHPVPNPVLSRTDACFSRTTTSGWIWNSRDRATSASPTLSIQKRSGAIFDLIDQSGGSNVGPLSRSWQPRCTKSRPFQRNISNSAAEAKAVKIVKPSGRPATSRASNFANVSPRNLAKHPQQQTASARFQTKQFSKKKYSPRNHNPSNVQVSESKAYLNREEEEEEEEEEEKEEEMINKILHYKIHTRTLMLTSLIIDLLANQCHLEQKDAEQRRHYWLLSGWPAVLNLIPFISGFRPRKRLPLKATPHSPSEAAMHTLIIKGGKVINEDCIIHADILVKDGKIREISQNLEVKDARINIIPVNLFYSGGIDSHTHFEWQSMGITSADDFFRGTKAALAGGTTFIVNCIQTDQNSLLTTFKEWKSKADSKVCCDYAFSVALKDWSEQTKQEMNELVMKHGVNSFKLCTASKDSTFLKDTNLYQTYKHCKALGALARIHAEHGDLISVKEEELKATGAYKMNPATILLSHPELLESEMTMRVCSVAQLANCPLSVTSVMSKSAAKKIASARQVVFGETTCAALGADGSRIYDSNFKNASAFVTSPPIRPESSLRSKFINRLACDELQMVNSGHCAFTSQQKNVGLNDFSRIPCGVLGAEERMMIVWQNAVNTGKMDLMRFVAVTSSNAAKMFNIYPKKGRIAVDSDADLVIWDPTAERIISSEKHQSASDCNIFEGFRCVGIPIVTISNGNIVYENGEVTATAGSGKYISLAPFSGVVYHRVIAREKIPHHMLDGLHLESEIPKDHANRTNTEEYHNRPMTNAGCRNLLDSTFLLSGEQVGDDKDIRRMSKRVVKPPGGESHRIWW
ncbi:Dihydropyrimidinase-related protein 3 [Trichinella murrelli]|uniref:Dihydropyrimidinase-related protein 3 n=1 Tax=Trichinella murrelli TaxID=144512 RepID=A0A0V0TH46_9BILA|nr:Dihydropyrimidinase-related protein 3 [Trichinella murrelli]